MGGFRINCTLWPFGAIPYVANYQHEFWDIIQTAILEIHTKTNIVLREKLPTDDSWIYFTCNKSKTNFARVGKHKGAIQVNVKHNVRALHELCHVIGMIHEHQRIDRDEYIELRKENFLDAHGMSTVSDIISKEEFRFGTDYDINSCMHYWCTAFCKQVGFWEKLFTDYRTLIYKKNPRLKFNTAEILSELDVQSINTAYQEEVKKRSRIIQRVTGEVLETSKDGLMEEEGITQLTFSINKEGNKPEDSLIIDEQDCNHGTKGKPLYLCYKTSKREPSITSIQVLSISDPKKHKINSSSYKSIFNGDGVLNWNQGTGGSFVSIWWSHEKFLGPPIKEVKIADENGPQNSDNSKWIKLDGNLNEGNAGTPLFIYFRNK